MRSGQESEAEGVFQLGAVDSSGGGSRVAKLLRKTDGIRAVGVNYITGTVRVIYDPNKVVPQQIRQAIVKAGHVDSRSPQRSSES